jgi:hypothetical protein
MMKGQRERMSIGGNARQKVGGSSAEHADFGNGGSEERTDRCTAISTVKNIERSR